MFSPESGVLMISRLKSLLPSVIGTSCRPSSSAAAPSRNSESLANRERLCSRLFDDAKLRVYGGGRNVDKMVVSVTDNEQKTVNYLLNRNISTAMTCAKHMSRRVTDNAAIAHVTYDSGATELISLNEPLTNKCELTFLSLNASGYNDAAEVNKSYWRSASILLAASLQKGITNSQVTTREPDLSCSHFSALVEGVNSWMPTQDELVDLSRFAYREFISNKIVFEYISVTEDIAAQFGYDRSMKLCRLGDYVVSVAGPTIAHCGKIGRFSLVDAKPEKNCLNVAATSIPASQRTSSYNWDLLTQNARQMFNRNNRK